MALARLNMPGVVLYGGSIAPGHVPGHDGHRSRTCSRRSARTPPADERRDFKLLEDVACPGAGACGGQFTANTMAIVCEALGISALGSGSVPATDPAEGGGRAGDRASRP